MTRRPRLAALAIGTLFLASASETDVRAHSGPPFPIVTGRTVGAYHLEVWADPDATDDGSAAGQFWVVVHPLDGSSNLPAGTRADVSVAATDRPGAAHSRKAEPVNGDITRQFAVLVMDHEGPFGVHVSVNGPLGKSDIDAAWDRRRDSRATPATGGRETIRELRRTTKDFLVVGDWRKRRCGDRRQ